MLTKSNKTQRDRLYGARVSPIVSFPGQGVVLFGDKTAQGFASAFDSFSELDEGNSSFWAAFEKRHGEGSVDKWFEEFGNIVQANPNARTATIYRYRPDMSSPE